MNEAKMIIEDNGYAYMLFSSSSARYEFEVNNISNYLFIIWLTVLIERFFNEYIKWKP